MKRKPKLIQKKLKFAKASEMKTCELCSKQVDGRFLVAHRKGPNCFSEPRTPNPATPVTDIFVREERKTTPLDIIMRTKQTKVTECFYLKHLGRDSTGRHLWHYEFANEFFDCWKSIPHKLTQEKRDPCEVHLSFCTNLQQSDADFYGYSKLEAFSPSLLKSLLQKAVRRGLRKSALKLSLQLAKNCGVQELARRLCVVILEDTILHPDFGLAAWAMGVGSNFNYPECVLESLLQIVADISSVEYKDELEISGCPRFFERWQEASTTGKVILLRAYYKGMAGDMEMLAVSGT